MMNKWMLSCQRATELMEKRTVVKLSLPEKVQLKVHTIMCTACRAYEQQTKLLDDLLSKKLTDDEQLVAQHSNPELKQKILDRIN